jgi:fimbrial chaperone protein
VTPSPLPLITDAGPIRAVSRSAASLAAILSLLLPGAAGAASLQLYPVRIVLTPDQAVETMTIHNEGDETVRGQLRLFAWRQADGADVLDETRDILANPPLFEIPPGGEQIARFGLRTQPGPIEKSYRVVLEEIPTEQPRREGELRTLLRISIPIFVPPAGDELTELTWRIWPGPGGQATIAIHNGGAVHAQIHRLTLAGDGDPIAEQEVSQYLLPGASHQVALDVGKPLQSGQSVTLVAQTDQGEISATIITEAGSSGAAGP